jgi:hypothetical protein
MMFCSRQSMLLLLEALLIGVVYKVQSSYANIQFFSNSNTIILCFIGNQTTTLPAGIFSFSALEQQGLVSVIGDGRWTFGDNDGEETENSLCPGFSKNVFPGSRYSRKINSMKVQLLTSTTRLSELGV